MPTLAELEAILSQNIAQSETQGGTTGVGASLNNPGGLQYSTWEQAYGAVQANESTFAKFPTLHDGYDAMNHLIDSYVQKGASIESMMNAWAPPELGNFTTPMRIQGLTQLTGLDPNVSMLQQVTNPDESKAAIDAYDQGNASKAIPTDSQQAIDAYNKAHASDPLSTSNLLSWLSVTRLTTIVVGLILLIAGLFMLKQTQAIVAPLVSKAKDAALAAVV